MSHFIASYFVWYKEETDAPPAPLVARGHSQEQTSLPRAMVREERMSVSLEKPPRMEMSAHLSACSTVEPT